LAKDHHKHTQVIINVSLIIVGF